MKAKKLLALFTSFVMTAMLFPSYDIGADDIDNTDIGQVTEYMIDTPGVKQTDETDTETVSGGMEDENNIESYADTVDYDPSAAAVEVNLVADDIISQYPDLSSVPISVLLDNLVDASGNNIDLEYNDESDFYLGVNKVDDTPVEAGWDKYSVNDSIDLSFPAEISSFYKIRFRLDGQSYLLTVFDLMENINSSVSFYLFEKNESGEKVPVKSDDSRSYIDPELFLEHMLKQGQSYTGILIPSHDEISGNDFILRIAPDGTMYNIFEHEYTFNFNEFDQEKNYYLNIIYTIANHPYLEVKVYFEDMLGTSPQRRDITDQVLNKDLYSGEGYEFKLAGKSYFSVNPTTPTSMFSIGLYRKTGENHDILENMRVDEYWCHGYGNNSKLERQMSSVLRSVKDDEYSTQVYKTCTLDEAPDIYGHMGIYRITLKDGYSANSEYYLSLILKNSGNVIKAVEGDYDSLKSAENIDDIKEQLVTNDDENLTKGYRANYKDGIIFTIFTDAYYGNILKIKVIVEDYDKSKDSLYMQQNFINVPVVGEKDPWFRAIGAYTGINDEEYGSYVIEHNDDGIYTDTAYSYGYQTVLINDENVDLSNLKPVLWYDKSMQAYSVAADD